MYSMNHEPTCVNLTGTPDNPRTGVEDLLPESKWVDYQHQYLRLLIEPKAAAATGYFLRVLAAVEQRMRQAHAEATR
jgi:hypothetical protein